MEKDYSINVNHFYSFEYNESGKKMVIELDFRDRFLYLSPSLITNWQRPYEKLEIPYSEKKRILRNIRECLIDEGWKSEEIFIKDEQERT